MTLERRLSKLFMLDRGGWERHANPWSVWSRYTVLPLFAVSGLIREWSEWWSWILFLMTLCWMFLNPVVFHQPARLDSWASKVVSGEQIYLNRDNVPLPEHHQTPLFTVLHLISAAGVILTAWGVYQLDIFGCMTGILMTYLGKSWFMDRMVWLYHDKN